MTKEINKILLSFNFVRSQIYSHFLPILRRFL